MDINNKQIWQQSCGDTNRNYASICLEWGVILNGPGRFGPLFIDQKDISEEYADAIEEGELSKRKLTDLRRFSETMKSGDIVVLRLGTNQAVAVGEVIGEYEWHDAFADVDGWDLQHVRRVNWFWKNEAEPADLGTYAFKQGDTTQIISEKQTVVRNWLQDLRVYRGSGDLVTLPDVQDTKTNLESVSKHLFRNGVDSSSLNRLNDSFSELVRIADWYWWQDEYPSENETVTYLVVPLLRALGWTPQKMAIEWNHVDVAMFSFLPRKPDNLAYVLEAKRKGLSCLQAQSQAEAYADEHECRQLIVTDGIRYGVFRRNHGFKLQAYINLLDLRSEYPILGCAGAQDAIWLMTPEGYSDSLE